MVGAYFGILHFYGVPYGYVGLITSRAFQAGCWPSR